MNELRLRFSDGDQPDLVLGTGVHALGRRPEGLGPVDDLHPWILQLCDALAAQPQAQFYAALAHFTRAFVSVETQGFDMLD